MAGARTPEELETLLEDAFVLHDLQALAQLFQPGAMLMVGGGLPEARGRQQITRVATRLWDLGRSYLAEPRRILQVRDTALVLASHAINVVHRGEDGVWRYAILFLDLEKANANNSDDQPEHRSVVGQRSPGAPARSFEQPVPQAPTVKPPQRRSTRRHR